MRARRVHMVRGTRRPIRPARTRAAMTNLNLIGRTIGRFEILSELGRGGMAVVYKARQASPSRIVALKVLPPELVHDASYIARFRQEADSAAALEHPHIVPIY